METIAWQADGHQRRRKEKRSDMPDGSVLIRRMQELSAEAVSVRNDTEAVGTAAEAMRSRRKAAARSAAIVAR